MSMDAQRETLLRTRIKRLENALHEAALVLRSVRGAISSGQIHDKDVMGACQRAAANADVVLLEEAIPRE
jgi:hypothetical protein